MLSASISVHRRSSQRLSDPRWPKLGGHLHLHRHAARLCASAGLPSLWASQTKGLLPIFIHVPPAWERLRLVRGTLALACHATACRPTQLPWAPEAERPLAAHECGAMDDHALFHLCQPSPVPLWPPPTCPSSCSHPCTHLRSSLRRGTSVPLQASVPETDRVLAETVKGDGPACPWGTLFLANCCSPGRGHA